MIEIKYLTRKFQFLNFILQPLFRPLNSFMRKGKDPNGSGSGTLLFIFYLYFILLCDSSLVNRGRTSLFIGIVRKCTLIFCGFFVLFCKRLVFCNFLMFFPFCFQYFYFRPKQKIKRNRGAIKLIPLHRLRHLLHPQPTWHHFRGNSTFPN